MKYIYTYWNIIYVLDYTENIKEIEFKYLNKKQWLLNCWKLISSHSMRFFSYNHLLCVKSYGLACSLIFLLLVKKVIFCIVCIMLPSYEQSTSYYIVCFIQVKIFMIFFKPGGFRYCYETLNHLFIICFSILPLTPPW